MSKLCLWCCCGLGKIGVERTGSKWKVQTVHPPLIHLYREELPLQVQNSLLSADPDWTLWGFFRDDTPPWRGRGPPRLPWQVLLSYTPRRKILWVLPTAREILEGGVDTSLCLSSVSVQPCVLRGQRCRKFLSSPATLSSN